MKMFGDISSFTGGLDRLDTYKQSKPLILEHKLSQKKAEQINVMINVTGPITRYSSAWVLDIVIVIVN